MKSTSCQLILNSKPDVWIDYKIPEFSEIEKQTKGYYCEKAKSIRIVSNNDTIGIIEISSPSVVAIADKEYPWGWFQFPSIVVNDDSVILVKWQMKDDSADSYGIPNGANNSRISYDNGKTWEEPSKNIKIQSSRETVVLPNGGRIAFTTPPTVDISKLPNFPLPVSSEGVTAFYRERDLPNKFKGVYVNYFHDNTQSSFHAKVNNENLIRVSINGKLATFWFGKLLEKNDDLYACVYPSYYTDDNGNVNPIAISFYKSSDLGHSWDLQGKIDYKVKQIYYPDLGLNKKGFSEPTFEFLENDTILCVMRTSEGMVTPMYKAYSSDYGVSWTVPEPITPNGVMPQLLRLGKNILLLASGRPGIQLRLSFDGKGDYWSSPIELIDYDENQNWVYNSCGYPFLYKVSDNEVYIVYSDFKAMNSQGAYRKSIVFRKLKVSRFS